MNVLNCREREKWRKDLRIYIMDYGRKRARKYTFKIPKVEELEKHGKLVVNPRLSRRSMEKFCLFSALTLWMGSVPLWCSFTIQRITALPFQIINSCLR